MTHIPGLALSLAIAVIASCADSGIDDDPSGLTWSAVPEIKIGDIESSEAAFTEIADIEVSSDGRIYALDRVALDLRVFSEDGRFLARVGRAGDGPGEFRSVGHMGWKGDTFWIEDPSNGRLTMLAPDLSVAATIRFAPGGTDDSEGASLPGWLLADGSVLSSGQVIGDEMMANPDASLVLWRSDRSGAARRRIGTFDAGKEFIVFGNGSMVRQPISDGMIHAVSPWGEAIWFVDRTVPSTSTGATFRLVSMSPAGDTLVDRRVPYEPLPLADAYFADLVRGITENALAGGIPAGMVREAREALATQAFRPDFHPPVTRLVGGVDSTIWVGREEVSDSVPWDVFDHTGSQVGSLLLARRVVVHRASRRAIWTVVAGQFGEPHVIRWRIEDAM